MHRESIYFSPFRLDLINKCLWRDEIEIPLVPKTYAVLAYLASHPGQLIRKADLLAGVWPDEHVSEAVLKLRISELCKLLGDDPKAPTYIETVHRRGYRFIALPAPETIVPHPETLAPSPKVTADNTSNSFIVGRNQALSQLRACYEQVCQGHRQVVFITGLAGMGKSALVESFLTTLATEEAIHISHGQCSESQASREAYLPLLEALSRLCWGSQAGQVVPLLQHYAPTWLNPLPSLSSLETPLSRRQQLSQITADYTLQELANVLEQLTVQAPLVFVLEDLQWSDPATLAALTLLSRRRAPCRLFLLGTYRPVAGYLHKPPIHSVKEELALHGDCQELPLGCLTEDDVRVYLNLRFGPGLSLTRDALVSALYQRTEGHPLFLVQIIADLISRGFFVQQGQAWQFCEPHDV